ncbi:MAG: tetratricopeptide repeat protein, partial [Porphyrobacter sp.]|nr:tetratricopeptide repeat protein [Porphyrobacter sp.]
RRHHGWDFSGARVMLGRVTIAGVVAVLAAGPAYAGDKVLFGPPPAWVVPHATPSAPTADKSALPVEILQIDNQVHVEGKVQTSYSRLLVKFVTSQGLSAGNLSYAWKPDTDDLTVNKVLIHRGDQTIDVLGEGQTFTILRREQDLEQATLTGMLTANLFPEGLQVGDVLETQVTVSSTNPVTGEHAEQIFGPLNIPAQRIDVSIEWPKGKPMRLAEGDDLPPWTRSQKNGFDTASLSLQGIEPIIPPRGAPARFAMVRIAEATDYRSWGEIAGLFVPLYAKAAQIPPEGPLRAELDRIRAASNDPVKRAEAALALVQGQIRYVALAMGTGGLVPADASETWTRRFGDCKAKTALLLGLLHELGISAVPVAVNSGGGDGIADRLPAVGLFDHILVRATIAGKAYWLDGTREGDTSLARLTVPAFGWGLPIEKGVTALVRMMPTPLDRADNDLAIEIDASKGIRGEVPVTIERTLRGDDAIATNRVFASLPGGARDQAERQYWRDRFDFIEPDKVGLAFDESAGELHLTLQGKAKMDWNNGWYETDDMGVGYKPDFSRAPGPHSDAPFAVGYPYFEHSRETILLPPGFTDKAIDGKTDIDETVGGIEYHRHASMTGNRFVIERSERSLVPELAYKDALAAEPRLRELSGQQVYLGIPNNYRPTESDIAVAMSKTVNDPDELVTLGNELLNAGKFPEAISRLTRATELDPRNVVAWADRGIAEADSGRLTEATASLDKAEAIDPKNVYMFHGRGVVAEKRRAYATAIAAYSKAIEQDPKDGFAFGQRAQMHLALNEFDAAAADALKATELKPDNLAMYGLRAFTFMALKKPDQATAELQRMMRANPDNPEAAATVTRLLANFGMSDKATAIVGPAATKTAAAAPTASGLFMHAGQRDDADVDGRLADLGEALKLDPDFVPALAARASILVSQGKSEPALADVERVLAHNPQNLDMYLLKANILRNLGRADEALAVAKAV